MATTRRVFLEILGAGAVSSGCVAVATDTTPPVPFGSGGSGAVGSGGNGAVGNPIGGNGKGAIGSGGTSTGGQIGTGGTTGSGGAQQGSGGSTGSGGARADSGAGGSTQIDAGTVDARQVDAQSVADANGGPARDAAPMLQPGDIVAGNVSNFQVGALNALSGTTVAVGRDAMGLYALTLVCTHQGCTAAPAGAVGARQVNCPCHGSQFDRNGAVIRGPAGRPLVHFGVTVDVAGNIIVHSNMQVAANVRVA